MFGFSTFILMVTQYAVVLCFFKSIWLFFFKYKSITKEQ